MVFHLGSLWRLYEARLLGGVKRISSVSGGSITAGVLGLNWHKLSFEPADIRRDFVPEVVAPVRRLASETIDAESIILGIVLPGRVSDRVAAAYDEHLFGGATLQDLPDEPRFVINATNVQSGAIWRFMKPYMRDYRVGEVRSPRLPLARAVAASSAFPPVLSPVEMRLDPDHVHARLRPGPAAPAVHHQGDPHRRRGLRQSGPGDGLEAVPDRAGQRRRRAVPSGGGAQERLGPALLPSARPDRQPGPHSAQATGGGSLQAPPSDAIHRKGAFWSIRTPIAEYGLADALPCPIDRTTELAKTPTRLKRLDDELQERLINWGYAVCDAALRRYVDPSLPRGSFPYPGARI